MAFHTPHGSARFRLPWSWSSFDYRDAVPASCGRSARRPLRDREGRGAATRRHGRSPTAASSPRRWSSTRSAGAACSARAPTSSRPRRRSRAGSRSTRDGGGDRPRRLDRPLARPPRLRLVGARRPASSASASAPTSRATTSRSRRRRSPRGSACDAVRYQGNWFPHRLRPAAEDGVFFAGDSAGHCFPLSGEGIRTAFYFGIACGRELRAVLGRRAARASRRCARYGAFSRAPRAARSPRARAAARDPARCRRAR